MFYEPLSDLIERIIRSITHSSHYETSRWHQLKCTVKFPYYRLKARIIDWWNEETYVPLFCRVRSEMRAVRYSAAAEMVGEGSFMLPLDIPRWSGLPHFTTSDACFAHISETWPHLSP